MDYTVSLQLGDQSTNRTTLSTTWATASPTAISNGCLSFRQCYMCHVWKGLKKTALLRGNGPSGKSNQRENGSANWSIPQQNMWAEQFYYIRRVPCQDNQIYLKGIHSYGFWKVLIKHYQYIKNTPQNCSTMNQKYYVLLVSGAFCLEFPTGTAPLAHTHVLD